MSAIARSLREMVHYWLSPEYGAEVRVTEFGRHRHQRHVRVLVAKPDGSVSMHFFRRGDGWWSVLPPVPERPTMQAWQWPQNERVTAIEEVLR
jgi:hypothetical protein